MAPRRNDGYLAYWNGRRGAERNPTGYRRRDDGSHIYHNAEDYYEWWYFDAAFDNGYHMVATFHYRNMFLRPMVPSIQMFLYCPDGTRIERYALIGSEEASADPDTCHVRMGESWVKDSGDAYALHIRIKDTGADLLFRNRVPPWKPGEGFNYRDEQRGKTAGWVVPVPHGDVEGELSIGERTVRVTGHGYHDHNWGNYRCHETFRAWYWGRVHHDTYAVDYGWVLPRDPEAPVSSPLLLARQGEILLSTDQLTLDLEDMTRDARFGQEYAGRLRLRSEALGVDFEMDIRTNRVLESTKLPKVTPWEQYYYRFLADYTMTLSIDGLTEHLRGEMLHEYIRL